jgi:GTP-binding protein Era
MPGDAPFRCGFVSLLGRPNVGKSTLMNRVLGHKIAATSPKPQTTRNQIIGIHNLPNAQAVYMDTPGIHHPKKDLNRRMVREARRAAARSDLAVMIIEAHRPWVDADLITLDMVETLETTRILAINKIDKVAKERVLPLIDHSSKLSVFDEIVPVSALKGDNVDRFAEVVVSCLPEGEAAFPPDMITDQAERFWAAEVVREKVVRNMDQELPYQSAVVVEEFEETPDLIRIRAVILVERNSQKPMIIGKGGAMIKKIGTEARREIEEFLEIKVCLDLFVRVEKGWWKDPQRVRDLKL